MKFIYDISENVTERSYRTVLDEFLEHFRSKPWILSIGSMGEMTDAGISDIDCIMVVENDRLYDAYREFGDWRSKSDIRKYLFFHFPVLVTERMCVHLPFLHTLHSLKWLHNTSDIGQLNPGYAYYLDIIWATYILSIALNMWSNPGSQSLRKALLILKNIHISCDKMKQSNEPSGIYLERSRLLREKAVDGGTEHRAIDTGVEEELSRSIHELLALLHNEVMPAATFKAESGRHFVSVKKNISLQRSPEPSITRLGNGHIVIGLNGNVIDHTLTPWQKEGEGERNFILYKNHLLDMYQLCRSENVPLNYVTPFDIPVYRGRFYLSLRNFLFQLYRKVQI